ncbi:MAG: type II secretion system F family protein, partial [Candidatus Pacebacteria bacterium]|nr:type II secretion system F family protein [Candidatus Paceibacterota bacterium]
YIISSIIETEKGDFFSRKIVLSGVSQKDIVVLTNQFATLFEAEISAIRIFRMLAGGQKNDILKKALVMIGDDISDGSSVANAMKKHPKIFSHFYINIIKAGEESGKLSQIFIYLSKYLERIYQLTSKVKGALVYPAFVVVTFLVVMYLMLTMVIPQISGMLEQTEQELPLITQVIVVFSDFLVDYGFIFIILIVIIIVFLFRYIKTESGKLAYDRLKLSIPLLKKLYQQLFTARMAGNLSMMLRAGVKMAKTMESTSKVVDNKLYEKILKEVTEDVRAGEALSRSLAKHPEFDELFIKMIEIGEESGKLTDILETLATFYEKEVMTTITKLTTLIQPVLLLILGGGVAILLSAVLLPIYSVTKGF